MNDLDINIVWRSGWCVSHDGRFEAQAFVAVDPDGYFFIALADTLAGGDHEELWWSGPYDNRRAAKDAAEKQLHEWYSYKETT